MNRFQLATCAVLGGALWFTSGCTKPGPGDGSISDDVKAKLYSDAATKGSNINVAVNHGTVTLTGNVPTSDVELEAMKIANAAPGVKGVNDQMKVDTAAASLNQLPDAGTSAPAGGAQHPPPAAATPTASGQSPEPGPPAPAGPVPGPVPVPAPEPEPVRVTVPAETRVVVRMIDSIDSGKNEAGQTFQASLVKPLISGNRVVIPAGANATVLLTDSQGARRIAGAASLEVRLVNVQYRGRVYKVDSSSVEETGKARGKSTAVRTGIGAVAGAIIGGIAGGGKGAAIGSAAGGGAGFGINALTHGKQVKIASETELTFRLRAPLRVALEAR